MIRVIISEPRDANMTIVAKNVLKARMLEYFRHVEQTGEEIIVTDHRKPVIRILPLKKKEMPEDIFSDLRGRIVYRGDLCEPTTSEWNET